MHAANLTISMDMTPCIDAVDLLGYVHEALLKRHGARFCDLERDIVDLLTGGELHPVLHELDPGHLCFGAPLPVVRLLRRARRLGVIQ